jgi:hypothetical protein
MVQIMLHLVEHPVTGTRRVVAEVAGHVLTC